MLPFHTALVTGATGFIGRHLVRRLAALKVTTHCLARASSLTAEVRRSLAPAHCLALDSAEPAAWEQALAGIAADVVFHLASPGVIEGKEPPEALIATNVRLMDQLLTAVQSWSLRNIVYTGTFSEYASSDEILTEAALLAPATSYGVSKAAAWRRGCELAGELGVPLVNLRLFHVYGPGEASSRLIPFLHDRLSRGQSVPLTPGEQVRDLVFVADIIDALLAAAALPPVREPRVFNVCSGVPVSVRQIGEQVAQQMNAPQSHLGWGELSYRPGEPMRAIGDNRRFFQATGWQPRVGLDEGIARSLASLGDKPGVSMAGQVTAESAVDSLAPL